MCKIIHLQPGFTPDFEMIQMATWNNPHGYGLILKDKEAKKLQLIKSGQHALENGNDPKEVYELLKDNEDLERFLHLRWKTEGDINMDNTQPFSVYHSAKRDIFFMHNGTLYDFRPPSSNVSYMNGVKKEPTGKETWSDTRRFAEEILQPLISRMKGENGIGDIHDPIFQMVVNKYWGISQHNRGILISSDQEPFYINLKEWATIENGGQKFLASNNSYFKELTRGQEFERRKKEEEEAKKARFQSATTANNGVKESPALTRLKDLLLSDQHKDIDIKGLLHDADLYTNEGLAALKNVTAAEWMTFHGDRDSVVALMLHMTDEYAELLKRYEQLVEYQKKLRGEADGKEEEKKVG